MSVLEAILEFDNLVRHIEEDDFLEAVSKINSFLYEALSGQRNRSGKVTAELMGLVKKCLDAVNLRLVKAHSDCVSAETKLKTIITHNKAYEALLKRCSGAVAEQTVSLVRPAFEGKSVGDSDYSVIVTAVGEESIDDLKKDLKQAWRSNLDAPVPRDVVTTKTGQLVVKLKTKIESERLKDVFTKAEILKDKIKVVVPRRRLERLLILGVDPEVQEETVKRSVSRVLQEWCMDDDSEIAGQDFEILKRMTTKSGRVNWLLGVGKEFMEYLINSKRICIDMERYRVVKFVPIVRCFKCQTFGHILSKCDKEIKCLNCAGKHFVKDCNVDTVVCANCKQNGDNTLEISHKADSLDCPVFKKYRDELLAKRL